MCIGTSSFLRATKASLGCAQTHQGPGPWSPVFEYRATAYQACSFTVHIGRRADALLRTIGAREACFLGADNPRSRRMPPGWNRRARLRLAAALRRVPTSPATGTWRRWSEAHLLAALPKLRARVLARRFRQNAIVVLRHGAPAALLWTVPWFDPHAPFLRPDLVPQGLPRAAEVKGGAAGTGATRSAASMARTHPLTGVSTAARSASDRGKGGQNPHHPSRPRREQPLRQPASGGPLHRVRPGRIRQDELRQRSRRQPPGDGQGA